MATIKVDPQQIEDHLAQQDSINITSFTWGQSGYKQDPEFEWELSSDLPDLEYDDDDYVDVDEFNKLREDYEQLDRAYDILTIQYNQAQQQILSLEQQVDALTAIIKAKPFWKIW